MNPNNVSDVHDTIYASVIEEFWGQDEADKFLRSQGRDKRAVKGAMPEPKKEHGVAKSLARGAMNRGFGDVVRNGGTGVGKQAQQDGQQMEAD